MYSDAFSHIGVSVRRGEALYDFVFVVMTGQGHFFVLKFLAKYLT